jgi:hypothetical protein
MLHSAILGYPKGLTPWQARSTVPVPRRAFSPSMAAVPGGLHTAGFDRSDRVAIVDDAADSELGHSGCAASNAFMRPGARSQHVARFGIGS